MLPPHHLNAETRTPRCRSAASAAAQAARLAPYPERRPDAEALIQLGALDDNARQKIETRSWMNMRYDTSKPEDHVPVVGSRSRELTPLPPLFDTCV